jgi:hypothetical protein
MKGRVDGGATNVADDKKLTEEEIKNWKTTYDIFTFLYARAGESPKAVLPKLIEMLREHGNPILTEFSYMLDPKKPNVWRLILKRGQRGALPKSADYKRKDEIVAAEYYTLLDELLSKGHPSPKKSARGMLARRIGCSDETIRSAIRRAHKRNEDDNDWS